MSWSMARSLDVALDEINRAAPHRSKISDGGIGDADHATRDSDHNPWLNNTVRARDFTDDPEGGFSAAEFSAHAAKLLGHHPALGDGAYVIYNRRIISTSRLSEGWRYYGGVNAHKQHVHVSVGLTGYDNTQTWDWPTDQEDEMNPAQEKLLQETAAGVARLEKQAAKEHQRDKNVRARDKRRHQRIMAVLQDVPADIRDAVSDVLDSEDGAV